MIGGENLLIEHVGENGEAVLNSRAQLIAAAIKSRRRSMTWLQKTS